MQELPRNWASGAEISRNTVGGDHMIFRDRISF